MVDGRSGWMQPWGALTHAATAQVAAPAITFENLAIRVRLSREVDALPGTKEAVVAIRAGFGTPARSRPSGEELGSAAIAGAAPGAGHYRATARHPGGVGASPRAVNVAASQRLKRAVALRAFSALGQLQWRQRPAMAPISRAELALLIAELARAPMLGLDQGRPAFDACGERGGAAASNSGLARRRAVDAGDAGRLRTGWGS